MIQSHCTKLHIAYKLRSRNVARKGSKKEMKRRQFKIEFRQTKQMINCNVDPKDSFLMNANANANANVCILYQYTKSNRAKQRRGRSLKLLCKNSMHYSTAQQKSKPEQNNETKSPKRSKFSYSHTILPKERNTGAAYIQNYRLLFYS